MNRRTKPTFNFEDEDVRLAYEELLASRDRLAGLPPITREDFNDLALALHETVFYCLTAPAGRSTLPLPQEKTESFLAAARSPDAFLFVSVVAVLAAKIATTRTRGGNLAGQLRLITNALDALAFEYRVPKRELLAALREVQGEVGTRIAEVKAAKSTRFRFSQEPEIYAKRKDKAETPEHFFKRVYAQDVPRGLTQSDIRRVDPAFYNVFHVWCSRHAKRMSRFVPTSR